MHGSIYFNPAYINFSSQQHQNRLYSMLQALFFTFLTGICWAAVGVVISVAVQKRQKMLSVFTLSMGISAIIAWIILPDYTSLTISGNTKVLIIIMAGAGITTAFGMLSLHGAMARGHQGLSWFVGQSAMIIPFCAGVIVFNNHLSFMSAAAIILVIAGLAASATGSSKKTNESKSYAWLLLALIAFCILGTSQVLTTLPSQITTLADNSNIRVPMLFLSGFVTNAIIAMIRRTRFTRQAMYLAIALCFVGLPGQLCLYHSMDLLQQHNMVAFAYPISIAVCLIAFGLYSALVIREHYERRRILGMICAACGLVLIAL